MITKVSRLGSPVTPFTLFLNARLLDVLRYHKLLSIPTFNPLWRDGVRRISRLNPATVSNVLICWSRAASLRDLRRLLTTPSAPDNETLASWFLCFWFPYHSIGDIDSLCESRFSYYKHFSRLVARQLTPVFVHIKQQSQLNDVFCKGITQWTTALSENEQPRNSQLT